MDVILLCVAIPVLLIGLISVLRYWHGDSIFGLSWPVQELNSDKDTRLLKTRLNPSAESAKAPRQ